jgi:Asp/Glu/hydantoin racemase
MKILVVNSNTSPHITELATTEARLAASSGTEVVGVTAPFGARVIETRGEEAIAAHATLTALAEHHRGCDAAVIACFGDPGLAAARELLPIPVVGIAEAAMLTACLLGGRFGIVTVGARAIPYLRELADAYGVGGRLAGIRTMEESLLDIGRRPDAYGDAFVKLSHTAVEEDGADSLILGGAVLAGMARRLRDRVPVPLLDGTACAVRQAETLVALGLRKATVGSYSQPEGRAVLNVAKDLADLFRPTA